MFKKITRILQTVYERLRPDGDLRSQTVKSGVWSVGLKGGTRGLQTVMIVILARILGPREFGLMGMALVTYNALRMFSQLGIKKALIQRSEANVDAFLDTAWTLQMARGLVLATILFVSAPAVAWFFDEPRVTLILRVIAVSPILAGMVNPSVVYFQKNLDIHKQFAFGMSGAVAKFVASVSVAIVYESVWALVVGFLVTDLAQFVASYALDDYRPRPTVQREQLRELVGYGKWITGSNAIGFVLTSGDDAVVGRLLSTSALGYYQLGYRLAKMPTMEISRSFSTVAFPMYSKLQEDSDALADALLRSVRLLSFVAFPAAVGIVLTAPSFVTGVLGSQWQPVIPLMQIVAVYGAFAALTSIFGDIWNAIGRPDIKLKINVVRLIVTGIVILPATLRYGFVGTAAAITGVFLVLIIPIQTHIVVRCTEMNHYRLLRELAYPTVASGVMGAVLFLVRQTIPIQLAVVEFVLLVLTGAAVYLSAVAVLNAHSKWEIRTEFDAILETL